MKILALEASTTSAKAMLYDVKSGKTDVITEEYGKLDFKSVLVLDQIFEKMISIGRRLADGVDIDVISLGTTWHSLILCDKDMKPVTPPYLWNNMMASEICEEKRLDSNYVDRFYKLTGCMVHAMYPIFKLEYLKKQGLYKKKHLVINIGTYLTWRMSGERVSTLCMESGSGFLNIHSGQYDKDILREQDIDECQMSSIISHGETVHLSRCAAILLGVKVGIPIIPAEPDGALNQVGVGATEKGVATLSIGTSSAIRVSVEEPILSEDKATWCYRSPIGYLAGGATNGCNCIDWIKSKIIPIGMSYEQIESKITEDNEPPVFLPFLYGERCPGWQDKRMAKFTNLRAQHTIFDMYESVQEGVLFNLYQCYSFLQKAGICIDKILLSGGILHSKRWTQMCADIFQKEMYIDEVEQGSLLGGVQLGMKYLGIIDKAGSYIAKTDDIIIPDSNKVEIYKKRYDTYLMSYEEYGGILLK